MIALFTDFGTRDPYVGQMHAVIRRQTAVPVVDLLHHVPNYDMRAGAYLLEALQRRFQAGDVFACVVDPGVGSSRAPVMVKADGKWYVGPDNGLFEIVRRRARSVEVFRIDWQPEELSASFHGRDLFAPAAAMLASGSIPACSPWSLSDTRSWPDQLDEIIYIDHFGNAMTGYDAASLSRGTIVSLRGKRLPAARTFSSAGSGEPFWYRNSLGLVEIAVREGNAAALLNLSIGDRLDIVDYEALIGAGDGLEAD
ncbi:MAG: SAM-dependent chlorinase/fluorinase [Arenicellales bacterium]